MKLYKKVSIVVTIGINHNMAELQLHIWHKYLGQVSR